MTKRQPWKIGLGSGLILLGIYLVFTNQENITLSIASFILIAIGITLLASY